MSTSSVLVSLPSSPFKAPAVSIYFLLTTSAFSHKYLQLPLIPTEHFLTLHPEHVGKDEVALTIARIDHEHAERVALEEQRQALLKKKQGLIADNKKRKDDLANLDKDLERFIDVSYWLRVRV